MGQIDENALPVVETGQEVVTAPEGAEVAKPSAVVDVAGRARENAISLLGAPDALQDESSEDVAHRFAESIPASDRQLTESVQLNKLLYVLADHQCSGVLSSGDKLGNLPSSIAAAFRSQNVEEVVKLMREFAADPSAFVEETDKSFHLGERSHLPNSVQKALISLSLASGPRSATVLFSDVADAIEKQVTGEDGAPSMSDILQPIKSRSQKEDAGNDKWRYDATKAFIGEVYPDLLADVDFLLIDEIASLEYQDRQNSVKIADILTRASSLLGDGNFEFSAYTDANVLGLAMQRGRRDEQGHRIEAVSSGDLLREVQDALKERLKDKFVKS